MLWTVNLEGGPRRVNHAAVAIGDMIYSFGGYCSGEDYHGYFPIDVHMLNSVSLRWSKLKTRCEDLSDTPFQRYGHTVVAWEENIYLWGGRNDEGSCNVLFCFDTTSYTWSKPKTRGQTPFAKDGHSACVIGDTMFVFGGYEEYDQYSQDVSSLDLKTFTWKHILTKGEAPSWRDFHTASPMGSRMYVFGGRGDVQGPYHSSSELYCNSIYYLDTLTMTWCKPFVSNAPIGRRSHSAFVYRGQLYIFGGYNELVESHFGEMHRYSPENSSWKEVKTRGQGPCPRRRQHCCLIGTRLYLFGGTSPRTKPVNLEDLEELPASLNGFNSNLMDHSDLHVLDLDPSLKVLCIRLVIENNLNQETLPGDIRLEISAMCTNNTITRHRSHMG